MRSLVVPYTLNFQKPLRNYILYFPIYPNMLTRLCRGVTTIRAFGSETRFLKLNEEKVDSNHRAFFYLWTANRWLCFRTDIISAFVVTLAGVGVMTGQLGAGWAGLTMTYALDFTQALLVCAAPPFILVTYINFKIVDCENAR